ALEERGRRIALLAVLVVHDLADLVERVDADEIAEGERPHRISAAEHHSRVDVLDARHTTLELADRVQHVGNQEEVHHEPGVVLRGDRHLPELPGEFEGAVERLVARGDGAHHLDQLHDRDRIEEVQAHEPVGPVRGRGHVGDGERAGVRREDRALTTKAVELPEQRVLHLEVLHDRLDDDVARSQVGHGGRERQPTQRRVPVLGTQLLLRDGAIEGFPDAPPALLDGPVVDLANEHVESGGRGDLGDAAPHEPTTDDSDLFDAQDAFSSDGWMLRWNRSSPAVWSRPDGRRLQDIRYSASTTMAPPWPPPMHAEPRPNRPPRRRSSCTRWIVMRAPDAASGCVSAIAPPFTLVFSGSSPSSFSTDLYWGANASLTSTRSMSSRLRPAFSRASRAAGAGPMPITLGSTPTKAQETIRPMGCMPLASAQSAPASTALAAPSPMPPASPAVTRPSFRKYGRSRPSASMVVSGRMCSSVAYTVSPLRPFTVTGTISASKRPASHAAFARCCDRR